MIRWAPRLVPAVALGILAGMLVALVTPVARAEPPGATAQGRESSPATDATKATYRPVEGGETLALEAATIDPELYGKPIQSVEVRVVGSRWRAAPPVTSVHIGDALSGDLVRRAIRELLDTGGFANAAAEAEAVEGGVAVTVVVLPRRLVAGFELNGGELDKNQTLRAMGIGVEDELTEPSLDEIRLRVLGFYSEHGYTDASVDVRAVDVDEPLHVLVAIDIAAGAPRKVTQRVFVIDPLEDAEVGDLKRSYGVRSGDRIDEAELTEADRDLTESLRKAQFYKAEVTHSVAHKGPVSKLYVNVAAGPRLDVFVEGNVSFDADDLVKTIDIGGKGIADGAEAAQRIRHHYVEYGFYDAEIDARIERDPKRAVDHLSIAIRENPRVRVDRRIYACLPKEVDPNSVGDEIDSFLEEELPDDNELSTPPASVSDAYLGSSPLSGARADPIIVTPSSTYAPETYQKALKHLRDLYASRGYLNAVIGPIQIVRARCASDSPPGECVEIPFAKPVHALCAEDASGLPVPEPALPEDMTCVPDRAHGVFCSRRITLRIPMILGPQTALYDVVFEGNKSETDLALARLANLSVGASISSEAIENARAKIIEHYQDEGYTYVDVRTNVEPSPDRTRARLRFSIEEHEPVQISDIVVKGAVRTDESLIIKRLALKVGGVYSRSAARDSEERIAQLGTFTSVSVGLEDPEVPDKSKRLVVTVAEPKPQYIEPAIGFSTGEGLRFAFEFGHRNIGGKAISLTAHVQLSYLFDFMILDSAFAKNLEPLPVTERLARRNSAKINFPDLGLGSLLTLAIEGIDLRDNQRDFGLTRDGVGPTFTLHPARQVVITTGAGVELNDVQIFNATSVDQAITKNRALERLLRFPDGRTVAVSERGSISWDRRDTPFAATKGTLLNFDVEHVDAFPADAADTKTAPIVSHFMRFRAQGAGYVRFTDKGLALAVSIGVGFNLQLTDDSKTYPDRLLYLGGSDSLRAFLSDSVVPEDVAQQILNPPDPKNPLKIDAVAVRGGDFTINPRVEFRIPLTERFSIGAFLDTGNVWVDPAAVNPFELRYALGAGIRFITPIGPLAFDGGFNLNRRPWEDLGAFHFSIGLF
ncbi:MAG: POTRA domain-containing protein [Polyangiaceae bacterium]